MVNSCARGISSYFFIIIKGICCLLINFQPSFPITMLLQALAVCNGTVNGNSVALCALGTVRITERSASIKICSNIIRRGQIYQTHIASLFDILKRSFVAWEFCNKGLSDRDCFWTAAKLHGQSSATSAAAASAAQDTATEAPVKASYSELFLFRELSSVLKKWVPLPILLTDWLTASREWP